MFSLRRLLPVVAFLAVSLPPPARAEDADDEKLLKGAGVRVDGPGLLEFFRKRTFGPADEKRAEALVRQLGGDDFRTREKASAGLKALGAAALPALTRGLADPDPEVKRRARACVALIRDEKQVALAAAAARLLAARPPDGSARVLLDYLPWATDETVEDEALMALLSATRRAGKLDPALPAALKDRAPMRVAAAALTVGRFGDAGQRAAVRPLLAHPDPRVRLRAAQGLLAARDKQAVPALLDLLTRAPLAPARQAEDLLLRLAGDRAPQATLPDDGEGRRACRRAWEGWWKANEKGLDLAKADVDPLAPDPTRRANDVTRRFIDAIAAGSYDRIRPTVDVPFVLDERTKFTTAGELEAFLKMMTTRGRQEKFTWKRQATMAGVTFARSGNDKLVKAFAGVPWSQVRVVFLHVVEKNLQEDVFVVVRVKNGRARIVGVGTGAPPAAKGKK